MSGAGGFDEPAFPISGAFHEHIGELRPWAEGMSLRDYFAGQALAGLYAAGVPGDVSVACYRAADAMLAERAKGRDA